MRGRARTIKTYDLNRGWDSKRKVRNVAISCFLFNIYLKQGLRVGLEKAEATILGKVLKSKTRGRGERGGRKGVRLQTEEDMSLKRS